MEDIQANSLSMYIYGKVLELQTYGETLTGEQYKEYCDIVNHGLGMEMVGDFEDDRLSTIRKSLGDGLMPAIPSCEPYEGMCVNLNTNMSAEHLQLNLLQHDLAVETYNYDTDIDIRLADTDLTLDLNDHTGLNGALLKAYGLGDITKEVFYADKGAFIKFSKDKLLITPEYIDSMIHNSRMFSQLHMKLFNKLFDNRIKLASFMENVENRALSNDLTHRLKGEKKKDDKYIKAKRPTRVQYALFRFRDGNVLHNKEDHIDIRLAPKVFPHIVLPTLSKSLSDDDAVYLLDDNRVVVWSNDPKDDRPTYGYIEPEYFYGNYKTIKDLKIDTAYLTKVLKTTVGEIQKYGEVYTNAIKKIKDVEAITKQDKLLQRRKIKYFYSRLKNLYVIARQATTIANKIKEV